jgi:ubiquitin-conjugating enzyme E2 Q
MDMDYEFDEEEEEDDDEDDVHIELEDEPSNKNKEKEGIDGEHIATLERLKANQRQDYLQGTVVGSVQASDRLMKELRDIYRSDSFKRGNPTCVIRIHRCLKYCRSSSVSYFI